ncbi:hypothetical protein F4780DRAFT_755413 [Xylariomycetidae sp. FL0641]|nr:hypothetical protein F4780DRAFT_755413 [Xylariomycetidae sp. FL0641]
MAGQIDGRHGMAWHGMAWQTEPAAPAPRCCCCCCYCCCCCPPVRHTQMERMKEWLAQLPSSPAQLRALLGGGAGAGHDADELGLPRDRAHIPTSYLPILGSPFPSTTYYYLCLLFLWFDFLFRFRVARNPAFGLLLLLLLLLITSRRGGERSAT